MAQNITIAGASYSDVPSISVPKTGSGTASFFDISDTTASAADVATGKYFYTAEGVKTEGAAASGSGGEPTSVTILIKQDEDGFLVLDETGAIPTAVGVSF